MGNHSWPPAGRSWWPPTPGHDSLDRASTASIRVAQFDCRLELPSNYRAHLHQHSTFTQHSNFTSTASNFTSTAKTSPAQQLHPAQQDATDRRRSSGAGPLSNPLSTGRTDNPGVAPALGSVLRFPVGGCAVESTPIGRALAELSTPNRAVCNRLRSTGRNSPRLRLRGSSTELRSRSHTPGLGSPSPVDRRSEPSPAPDGDARCGGGVIAWAALTWLLGWDICLVALLLWSQRARVLTLRWWRLEVRLVAPPGPHPAPPSARQRPVLERPPSPRCSAPLTTVIS